MQGSKTADEIKEIVKNSYKDYGHVFANAAERLAYEQGEGYIVPIDSVGGDYTIAVNKYTGVMYYKNNNTGEVLSSNPGSMIKGEGSQGTQLSYENAAALMSQISIRYAMDSGEKPTTANGLLHSAPYAAERGQISVSYIPGGIRVNYTIGDTTTRYNVPAQIMEESFVEDILMKVLEVYESYFYEVVVEPNPGTSITEQDYKFFEKAAWKKNPDDKWPENVYKYTYDTEGDINLIALNNYASWSKLKYSEVYPSNVTDPEAKAIRAELDAMNNAITLIANSFTLTSIASWSKSLEDLQKEFPYYAANPDSTLAIYVCTQKLEDGDVANLQKLQSALATYAGYTLSDLIEHEEACLYEHEIVENPVFKCSLEYTFADDGALLVRMPVNSISFDEDIYNIESITPLQYFGAANLTGDGYVFVPDGSGSIIDFEDFYSPTYAQNVTLNMSVYGDDFAYANPTGKHKEAVTLPVFGIVGQDTDADLYKHTDKRNAADKGFFAILEEGAALATINVMFGGLEYRYASTYASYSPYPSDQYVSNSATGGGTTTYTIVSNSKYTGSYVTRYVMLGEAEAYKPTYVEMARYYREYLKARGELTSLEGLGDDLPLYIEALGSMDVVDKILTFPVTVSKPLTTFDDIVTMYKELADVKTKFAAKAKEYREKAAEVAEVNLVLYDKYLKRAEEYDKLNAEMESITNVNFKLTGFANGGMYFSYPTKVDWESACGGKGGFLDLIDSADEYNFGVFPEFDFSYMSNSAWFDGISEGTDLSRMVDNRYASKQVYNSVLGMYESFFSMVISTDALDRLYTKFNNSYSKYDHKYLSAASLGSDLNSNFDKDNSVNRDEAASNVVDLLDRIANEDGYEVMLSLGNSYTLGYADHILGITTDSSHFIYSSYTVPFVGMVLHSYVNYAGTPLNYAGDPDYDILRAIENGASLYYILCYDNTEFMKEDPLLNDYYGIDYQNWYDKLVQQYNKLNGDAPGDAGLGKYQEYEIVDHSIIMSERVIDSAEVAVNNELLKREFIQLVVSAITDRIDDAYDAMYDDNTSFGKGISLTVDIDYLIDLASAKLNIEKSELDVSDESVADFRSQLESAVAPYLAANNKADGYVVKITAEAGYELVYKTNYDFVTDSYAYDENYDATDYTADNKRVVVVTYKHPVTGHEVRFILNYNVYTVKVRLDATREYELPKYGFVKIEG